jgi:hypothetical protein
VERDAVQGEQLKVTQGEAHGAEQGEMRTIRQISSSTAKTQCSLDLQWELQFGAAIDWQSLQLWRGQTSN